MSNSKLDSRCKTGPRRRVVALTLATVGLALSNSLSWSQSAIDADAHDVLIAMTNHLKSLKAFSVDYDADQEIVDNAGQKIQYSASGTITASRSEGFRITRNGLHADVKITFDGKVISLSSKNMNAYARIESPGPTIDQAVKQFRVSTGLDVAGADLLTADPFALLTEGVTAGKVVGKAFVGGVECDQLAFRTDTVDWQIWVRRSEQPLPIKYVVTAKRVSGAPQYSLRLANWNVAPAIDPQLFSFTPPAGAQKLERIYSDEVGELTLETAQ